MCTEVEEYNVVCIDCGRVWQPPKGNRAWWYAKRYHQNNPNSLSAPGITAKMCGCQYREPYEKPQAPYRVIGSNEFMEDFNHGFYKFTEAVKLYRELERSGMNTVFMMGISERVERAIRLGPNHQNEMDEMRREHTAASMADQADFDRSVNEFFDRAFEKVEAGEMPVDQLRQFFPQTR